MRDDPVLRVPRRANQAGGGDAKQDGGKKVCRLGGVPRRTGANWGHPVLRDAVGGQQGRKATPGRSWASASTHAHSSCFAAHDRQRSPSMNHRPVDVTLSRRNALAGLGIGGLAIAARGSLDQRAPGGRSGEPPDGGYLARGYTGRSQPCLRSGGWLLFRFVFADHRRPGRKHLVPESAEWGPWEPDSEYGIHFTSVRMCTTRLERSRVRPPWMGIRWPAKIGESFYDDGSRVRVTMRDASGAITLRSWRGRFPSAGLRKSHAARGSRVPGGNSEAATPAS